MNDTTWSAMSSTYFLSTDNLTLTILDMQYYEQGVYIARLGNLAGDVRITFNLTYAGKHIIFCNDGHWDILVCHHMQIVVDRCPTVH